MTDLATTATIAPDQTGPQRATFPAGWGTAAIVAGAWIVLIIASGIHRPDFLSHQTVLAVSFTMAIVGVLAVGQALIGISGSTYLELLEELDIELMGAADAMQWPLLIVGAAGTGSILVSSWRASRGRGPLRRLARRG